MSLETVQFLLRKYRIKIDDRLGQNFLCSDAVLNRIVSEARLATHDHVLEIGSGIGNLTALLAEKCEQVVAVEFDRQFEPLLTAFASVNSNVHCLFGDILALRFDDIYTALGSGPYHVIANIPYYITARIMKKVIGYSVMPTSILFLMQDEVARRIVAKNGDQSKLSLSVQFYGDPTIAFTVGKEHFFPMPEVDSAVMKITNLHSWNYPESEQLTWRLIAFGFSSKRKKLVNNLSAGLQMPRDAILGYFSSLGIDVGCRAQDLGPAQWLALAGVIGPLEK